MISGDAIALLHAAATLFMTGLIWFVQVVHYPLFREVPEEVAQRHALRHQRLTGWVVGPPMLVEAATAVLLVAQRPEEALRWLAAGLLAIVWLSTALLQIPEHDKLAAGPDPKAADRLVAGNWLRTVAWSLRAGLALTFL